MKQTAHQACVDRMLATELQQRLIRLTRALDGRFWIFETISSFVTGLGRSHPTENGFAWHHLLGSPYIPGSTLKGMLKAWAQWSGEPAPELAAALDEVTLFDGLPVLPIRLRIEVMTPHYSKYYQGKCAPSDDHQPIPIPFLAVGEGQRFVLAGLGSAAALNVAEQYLGQTMEWMGVGAKTSSGLGRFARRVDLESALLHEVEEQEAEAKHADRLAKMPSLKREMWTDGYEDDAERFKMAITTKWLSRMEDPAIEGSERQQIAVELHAWYRLHQEPGKKPPSAKTKEKLRRILAVLARGEEG